MSPEILTWIIAALATGGRHPAAVQAGPRRSGRRRAPRCWSRCACCRRRTRWPASPRALDVYLFLTGMMLLSEIARRKGLFDWLAGPCRRRAGGSASRLFLLVYRRRHVVTIFLSNDATAVVLTPAVAAGVRREGRKPLPYLLICAFIANAASSCCRSPTRPTW
jgi:arsenical pump membrane protein